MAGIRGMRRTTEKIQKVCDRPNCRKKFTVQKWREDSAKYCCNKCRMAALNALWDAIVEKQKAAK